MMMAHSLSLASFDEDMAAAAQASTSLGRRAELCDGGLPVRELPLPLDSKDRGGGRGRVQRVSAGN